MQPQVDKGMFFAPPTLNTVVCVVYIYRRDDACRLSCRGQIKYFGHCNSILRVCGPLFDYALFEIVQVGSQGINLFYRI
jgi:hypothetical protein